MLNRPQALQHTTAKCCAMCGGKFGLIRHYSWRSPLCSRKCAERFKVREKVTAHGCGSFKPAEAHSKDPLAALFSFPELGKEETAN